MKLFFKILLALVGGATIVIVGIIVYLIVKKPFGIDVLKIPAAIETLQQNKATATEGASTETTPTATNPLLTPEQSSALESLGIDPSTLPTSLTDTQIACLTTALGSARVEELKNGATPTVFDLAKASSCL